MKAKMILISMLLVISATMVLSYNYLTDNKKKNGFRFERDFQSPEDVLPEGNTINSGIQSSIHCNGKIFDKFPDLDGFENKSFANILKKINKVESKVADGAPYDFFGDDINKYLFANISDRIEKNEGFSKYDSRIDGEKIGWAPVALLPTNGKFVMLIIVYWEKDAYEPSSKGFYLTTFSLKGQLLSMAYIYGYEEFNKDINSNKNKLSSIWGRAYCLNTNQPIIRKAVNWNSFIGKGGITVTTLEVKEIKYSIDEGGIIKIEKEKIIFPRTNLKWEDRAKVTFESRSDTILKMLGELE